MSRRESRTAYVVMFGPLAETGRRAGLSDIDGTRRSAGYLFPGDSQLVGVEACTPGGLAGLAVPAPIWWTQINYGPVANEQIQLADVDGDGKDDVFWANPYDGRWYISYGATSLWSVGGAVNVPYDQLRLGDLNGDGKDDVFWIRPWDGDWLVSYGAVSGWAIINNSNIPVAQIRLAATGSAP